MTNMWGIHNDTLTTELVDEGFVSVGWDPLGDLATLGESRDELKEHLTNVYPDRKPMTVAAWAGSLLRFRDAMQPGDVIVAPYRPDSTVNIGIITSDYYFDASAETHRHRRRVDWKGIGIPRTVFSEHARYEIGSLLTVFAVRKHADEFRAVVGAATTSVEEVTAIVDAVSDAKADDETSDEPRASRIDRHTRDFILETLHRRLSHLEFEEFTADLLRAVGYQARVTAYSQDGGVDVIAHRDPLGIEPPLIKVQCKHHTGTISAPEVQQLIGTQGTGELSLFVTLGGYTKDARSIERARSGLRLLTGEDIVSLVMDNYSALASRWRTRIPLTSALVVDDAADL